MSLLSAYEDRPITYAGGVHDFADLSRLKKAGKRSYQCNDRKRAGSVWREDGIYRGAEGVWSVDKIGTSIHA